MRSLVGISATFLFLPYAKAFSPLVPRWGGLQRRSSSLRMSNVKTGKVKWFDPRRGFGFITLDDGSGDVYVHQTNINMEGFRKLLPNELVQCHTDVDLKRGKTFAHNVVRIGAEEDIQRLEAAAADAGEAEAEAMAVAKEAEKAAAEIAAAEAAAVELARQAEEDSAAAAAEAKRQQQEKAAAIDAIAKTLEEEKAALEAKKLEEEKVVAAAAKKKGDDPLSMFKNLFKF